MKIPGMLPRVSFLFIVIAVVLTIIFSYGLADNEFFFLHDEFLVLPEDKSQRVFSIHDPNNFGAFNITPLLVNFFDRGYYNIFYFFNSNPQQAQELLFFLKLFLILMLPFLGFSKLSDLFLGSKKRDILVLCIALWYAFNTYTLIYWNNNSFSLTLLLAYALAPLTLYFIHCSLFEEQKWTENKIKAVIFIFLMSFALPLFLAFLLFVFIYVFMAYGILRYSANARISHFNENNQSNVNLSRIFFRNILLLILLYVPFSSTYILMLYGMVSSTVPTMYLTGGETYGNLSGGILYQILMWFSWGIYTEWEPKSIFTFAPYFRTWYSFLAPFFLYGIIAYGIKKKNFKNAFFLTLSCAFLLFLTLVKGAQDPFGGVYLYLLDQVSFFRVFRSPDSKFGFIIVLTLAMLLLFTPRDRYKKIFALLIIITIFIQGWPLFSGIAIRGENSAHSYDRIIHISESYRELASFMNDPARAYGYITTLPAAEFGLFQLDRGDQFIGQDLLPKLIRFPFVQISENGSLPVSVYQELVQEKGFSLKKYPIRYYIFRNDISRNSADRGAPLDLKSLDLIFQNDVFTLYENKKAAPLVQTENGLPIIFKRVSPTKYMISIRGVKEKEKLFFNENYHTGWRLSSRDDGPRGFFSDLSDRELFDGTHTMENDFSNAWTLEPASAYANLNKDADIKLWLYFKPQVYFQWGISISVISLFGYLIFLSRRRGKGVEY